MMSENSLCVKLKDCSTCKDKLNDLQYVMNNRPYKYDTRVIITLQQDYLGSEWHLTEFKVDQYNPQPSEVVKRHEA